MYNEDYLLVFDEGFTLLFYKVCTYELLTKLRIHRLEKVKTVQ